MSFTSPFFALFLPFSIAVIWGLRSPRIKVYALILLNALFFAFSGWKPLLIMGGLVALSFAATEIMIRAKRPAGRDAAAFFAIGLPLAGLIFGKMVDVSWFNLRNPVPLLGLSYFSFQIIGYVLDLRRGATPPVSFVEYTASVTFFPAISAGPILRTADMADQLRAPAAPSWDDYKFAILLICNGLAKKAVGDMLGKFTDPFFRISQSESPLQAVIAVIGLSARIYADFSGYTDIARGAALFLGYRLPDNFQLPFLARSVSDHWRRWHITLNDWFRDYVFQPAMIACWPRKKLPPFRGQAFTALFLILTTGLIGLWHRLDSGYLLWGLLNGVLISLSPLIFTPLLRWRAGGVIALALTFYLTALGRVIGEASSLGFAFDVISNFHHPWLPGELESGTLTALFFTVLAVIVPHALDAALTYRRAFVIKPAILFPLAIFLATFALCFGSPGEPFFYIQF